MKLQTKLLSIPSLVTAIVFFAIGGLFLGLTILYSQNLQRNEMQKLLLNESQQLLTKLSIVLTSHLPADAFLGLEEDDVELADELLAQGEVLGMDGMYFTDLSGRLLYPESEDFPQAIHGKIAQAQHEDLMYHAYMIDQKLVGCGKIVDIDEPKGYLMFVADIPESFFARLGPSFSLESARTLGETKTSEYLKQMGEGMTVQIRSFLGRLSLLIIISFLLSMAIILASSRMISRNIIERVNSTNERLSDIVRGEGDLTKRLVVDSDDELGDLARHFNSFMDQLEPLVFEITQVSEHVKNESSRLVRWMSNLIDGAPGEADDKTIKTLERSSEEILRNVENQAVATEEASAITSEISATINSLAQNTEATRTLAEETLSQAQQGGRLVEETLKGIHSIQGLVGRIEHQSAQLGMSSNEIGTILETIENIAGQTHLLALNATIEAVRAGEKGKGFVVVAEEVKNLSKMTQAATRDIEHIIHRIQQEVAEAIETASRSREQVNDGTRLAEMTAQKIHIIIEKVDNTNLEVSTIANAMAEVVGAVTEITTATLDISDGSQNIEELSSAQRQTLNDIVEVFHKVLSSSHALSDVANGLSHLAAHFKVTKPA